MNKDKLKKLAPEIKKPSKEDEVDVVAKSAEEAHANALKGMSKRIVEAVQAYQDEKFKGLKAEAVAAATKLGKDTTQSIKDIRKEIEGFAEQLSTTAEAIDEDFAGIYKNLDELSESIDEAVKEAVKIASADSAEKFTDFDKRIAKLGETFESKMGDSVKELKKLTQGFDKKNGEVWKKVKLLSDDSSVHYKSGKKIGAQVLKLEEELKKMSKSVYEFGSSFSILANGTLVGATFGINFKSGTNTTVSVTSNQQGFIDVAINAQGGGAGFAGTQEKSTTVPNGVRTTFAFAHVPSMIIWNGAIQTLTDDYTVSGNNITFTSSAGIPQTNDKIINIYA